jgi:hypothetical protein
VRTKLPALLSKFEIDAEGDTLCVYCATREPLERLAAALSALTSDMDQLIEAIEEIREELE